MRPYAWKFGLLIVVIASGILVLTRPGCSGQPIEAALTKPVQGAKPPLAETPPRSPVRTAIEVPATAEELLRVTVLAESGEPIHGAWVGFWDGRTRALKPDEDWGRTDGSGVAHLHWETAGNYASVAVWAEGWQPASAPVEPGRSHIVLQLAPGLVQRISVTDVWGAPISGATATFSQAGLPDSRASTAELAAPSPQAVHRARADAFGSITFRDLNPGDYYYVVSANGYIPREQPDGRLTVPGEDIGVVLEPLGGIIADAAEGPILAYAMTPPEVTVLDYPRPPGQGEWRRQSAAWSRRFPGAISFLAAVVPERRDALRTAGVETEVAAFVAGRGWGVGPATIRLLPEAEHPERLRLDWRSGSKSVRIYLLAPDGTRVENGTLQVRCKTPIEGLEAAFEVPLGEATELPLGQCSLQRSRLPVPFGAGDGVFLVTAASDRIDVPILAPCRQVEVRVRLPDGTHPNGALLQIRGTGVSMQVATVGGRLPLWVTHGPLEIQATVTAAAPWSKKFPSGLMDVDSVDCDVQWAD